MLHRLFRKMANNLWMVTCLLTGFILASAMVSTIPIYTKGAMQRMLIKDLENYQVSTGSFPGTYSVKASLYALEKPENKKNFDILDKEITGKLSKNIGIPIISETCLMTSDFLLIKPGEGLNDGVSTYRNMKVEGMRDFTNHVKVIQGRMFNPGNNDGVYEVVVSEKAVQKLDLMVGRVYPVSNLIHEEMQPVNFKVVGIFTINDKNDPFWLGPNFEYPESFFMDVDTFYNDYLKNDIASISYAQWYYAFDYHKISADELAGLQSEIEYQQKYLKSSNGLDFKIPMYPIIKKYNERAWQLKIMLLVIQVPVMLMLGFYLFMVSRMVIDQEENEIAVLKSRGTSRKQIVLNYFVQGLILGIAALITGPPLGLLMCKILGSSNGFLKFVQRAALPVTLGVRPYIYSLCAIIIIIATMLIPVIPASRTTIVLYKQKKVRYRAKQLWEKYFLDILMLGISCYGLYAYKMRQGMLKYAAVKLKDVPMDPLLFIISTFFILSLGLIFLRVYPYIIKLIFRVGRRKWPSHVYASLVNVGRSKGMEQFLMLFLVLTISVGVFNANAARTINNNIEEKVRYGIGADVVLMARWENNKSVYMGGVPNDEPTIYYEPDYSKYSSLSGIEMTTKVLKVDGTRYSIGREGSGNARLMGIIPNEFGKIAWFRNDLLPYHWYNYLNLLSKSPRAMLVSRTLQKKFDVKIGDSITIYWGEENYLDGIVFQFIDYWPSFNPYEGEGSDRQDVIVANLSYIQAKTPIEPYEVWMKKKPGTTSSMVYNDIREKGLGISSLKDTSQQIIVQKGDPLIQGTNGALTQGFVVTMIISTIGFLIYWILSIKGRTLQFGIFRAMGISIKEIIGMLVCEQILISGTSILMGIVTGGITSDLFVPLLQIASSSGEQVPPFKVTAYGGDYIKIYVIVGFMLILGLVVLGKMISKIRIDQAIKLGED